MLSLLIQARDDENRGMTDTELVGQATILFGASFETTASTLTWTVFLLAQHPAIMGELMDELDRVLGGNAPTRDQLAQLSFLDRVIKESMRILPPVPFTIRAADDDAIPMGSLTLSHGTRVICSHFLTHHLPEIYPEPEIFRPDRWRDIDPTQYEYMPFSAGPRACVGAMFAIQVLKISLGDHVAKIPLHRGTGRAHRSRCSHHNEPAIWHADAINEERSPFSEQRSARSNSRDGEVTVATRRRYGISELSR